MKIGAMNHPGRDVLNEIETFGKLGFDFVDLTIEGPNAMPEDIIKNKKGIIELAEKYNLFLIGHSAWFLPVANPYEELRKSATGEIIRAIEACAKLNIRAITIHPWAGVGGVYHKEHRNDITNSFIKSMKAITKKAEDAEVDIFVENNDAGIFKDVEEFKIFFEQFPKTRLLLDVGHANINKNIFEFIETFGERLSHLHFSDNKGSEDEHLPVGLGNIDWQEVINALKDIKYDKTITLEIHAAEPYLELSKKNVLGLWQK